MNLPSLAVCGSSKIFSGCTGPLTTMLLLFLISVIFAQAICWGEKGTCWKVCTLPSFLGRETWVWDFLHKIFIKCMTLPEPWLVGKLQRTPDYWTPDGILEIDKHDQGFPNPQPAKQRMDCNTMAIVCFAHYFKALDNWMWFHDL